MKKNRSTHPKLSKISSQVNKTADGSVLGMLKKYFHKKKKTGFTMIEMLIVLAIVGIFSTAGAVGFQMSQSRARDAERKADLEKIKVAFEDYYNDKLCYPPEGQLDNCGSGDMRPYLDSVPCDPLKNQPYLYTPLANECTGYRVHTALENKSDDDIARLKCDTGIGCGYQVDHNYGISAGVPVLDPEGGAIVASSPSPTPSGSASIYFYACDTSGTCNRFEDGHPALLTCPVTFEQSNCNNECGNPAVRCQ